MAKVLLAASGGGHLEQLILVAGGLSGHEIHLATTDPAQARQHRHTDAATLPDCNLHEPWRAIGCAATALALVLRIRPHVVVTTGAAPGFFCLLWGRMVGARVLWIDSVANADRLSLSGRMARRIAHRCLTQWEHLADGAKVAFAGSVL